MAVKSNDVHLTGTVRTMPVKAEKVYGEQFYTFTLSVVRRSKTEDLIVCRVSERMSGFDDLVQGAYIDIKGRFTSYNSHEGGKTRLILSVFVEELKLIEYDESIEDINSVNLSGEICKFRKYRTVKNRDIFEITLVVTRSYSKKDYLPVVLWGRNANYCKEHLSIGDELHIEGRIQSREYTKTFDDGTEEKRTAYEVSSYNMEVIE